MSAPCPARDVLLALSLAALAQCASRPGERAPARTVRFATFNVALFRAEAGALAAELAGDSAQARAVAAVLRRVRPDVVLLNELDHDAGGLALDRFVAGYLAGAYPHRFTAPVNTGVPSGRDLDRDGRSDGPGDALGYGAFPGQYGMAVLSRYPILRDRVRTWREFRWRDVPGALLPDDPATPEPADWYGAADLDVLRLASKSVWDVPIDVDGCVVHLLASHPTPPVFDGPEDRNGRRNHDEIRLLADLLDPAGGGYLRDDRGQAGGLPAGAHFVVAGDLNADPLDGDSRSGAIQRLLAHPRVRNEPVPHGPGGAEQARRQGGANAAHRGDPAADTADFDDRGAGNLRIDYVLPSRTLEVVAAGVHWPPAADPGFAAVQASSDHRLVWVDLRVEPGADRRP